MAHEHKAILIYAAAGRDVGDALDMILECQEPAVLEFLYKMLTAKGSENTDVALNKLLAGPVKRRLNTLNGSDDGTSR